MIDKDTWGRSGHRGLKNLGELVSGDYPTFGALICLLLLTGSKTMLFELGDEGLVYDLFVCSDHSQLSST